jgi:hypothetical protein
MTIFEGILVCAQTPLFCHQLLNFDENDDVMVTESRIMMVDVFSMLYAKNTLLQPLQKGVL